jgi:hypothetical protein
VLDASTHAAAKLGVREYSRINPPSLARHLIVPVLTPRKLGRGSREPRREAIPRGNARYFFFFFLVAFLTAFLTAFLIFFLAPMR